MLAGKYPSYDWYIRPKGTRYEVILSYVLSGLPRVRRQKG